MLQKQQERIHWVGKRQIMLLLFCGILFLAYSCLNTGMTNTVMPTVCELRGWNYAGALPFMSYGGYIGAIAVIFWGQLVFKKGPRLVIIIGLLGAAVSALFYGTTNHYLIFVLCMIGNRVFGGAYFSAGITALLNSWFPKTKGIVLGWATMGIVLSDVLWSPYIPNAIANIGVQNTFVLVAIGFFILALLSVVRIKNTPGEVGLFPDNTDPEIIKELELNAEKQDNTGPQLKDPNAGTVHISGENLTWRSLLKNVTIWKIGIAWGLLWMIAVTFISQIVNRCVTIGYDRGFAVLVLQIASIVALGGSWLFGFLDQRLGTRRASVIFSIGIACMFLLCLLQPFSPVFIWISACGIMACSGGICNLIPSMTGTVFGQNFAAANRIISPVSSCVMASAFLLTSLAIGTPLGLNGMYIIDACIAIICLIVVISTKAKK